MTKRITILMLSLACFLNPAHAVKSRLNFQAVLNDGAGDPIDGTIDVVFRLYDASTGGTLLWEETHDAITPPQLTVVDGLFDVTLGDPAHRTGGSETLMIDVVRFRSDLWLSIQIAPDAAEMSPRIEVTSSAWALEAASLNGLFKEDFLRSTTSDAFEFGTLQIANGAVLDVDGDLVLGGTSVSATGLELSKLAGTSANVSPASLNLLTSGGDASALHSHSNVDASLLQGLYPEDFLRSNTSDAFSLGTLQIALGALLDVDGDLAVSGEFTVGGTPVLADGAELSKLAGTSATVTATSLNLLTSGGDASSLHTHTGLDAASFDGLDSTQFLRSDTDTIFDGTAGASIVIRQPAGATKSEALWLRNNSTSTGSNSGLRFQMSSNVNAYQAAIRAERQLSGGGDLVFETATSYLGPPVEAMRITEDGVVETAGDLSVGVGAGSPQQIHFGSTGPSNTLAYNTADGFSVADNLTIGLGSSAPQEIFFGSTGVSSSLAYDSTTGFSFGDNLISTGSIYAGNNLYVGTNPSSSLDSIYFHDGDQFLAWVSATERFQFSYDVDINGYLWVSDILGAGTFINVRADGHLQTVIDAENDSTVQEARWFQHSYVSFSNQLAELQEDGDFRIAGTLSQNVAFDVAETFWAGEAIAAGELVRIDPTSSDTVLRTTGTLDGGVIGVVSTDPGVLLGDAPFDRAALGEVWGADRLELYDLQRGELADSVLAQNADLRRQADKLLSDAGALEYAKAGGLETAGDARSRFEGDVDGYALETFFDTHTVPVALAGRVPVRVDATFGAIEPGDLLAPSPRPGIAMKSDGSGTIVATALEALDEGEALVMAFVRLQSPGAAMDERVLADLDQRLAEVEQQQAAEQTAQPADSAPAVADRTSHDAGRASLVDTNGNLRPRGAVIASATEIAEMMPISEPVEAGDVLVLDAANPGFLRPARWAEDSAVLGIAVADPGIVLGADADTLTSFDPHLAAEIGNARSAGNRELEAELTNELETSFYASHVPVAVSGSVLCKADAADGAIAAGDLLVSSDTPGHARRADHPAPGTVIGKALEALDHGTGTIRVLVMLR